jgi:hypothetical protein
MPRLSRDDAVIFVNDIIELLAECVDDLNATYENHTEKPRFCIRYAPRTRERDVTSGLSDFFLIKIGVDQAPKNEWKSFLSINFSFADYDQYPELRVITCLEHYHHLTPESVRDKIRKFSKVMFGCTDVAFVRTFDLIGRSHIEIRK